MTFFAHLSAKIWNEKTQFLLWHVGEVSVIYDLSTTSKVSGYLMESTGESMELMENFHIWLL